MLKAKSPSCGKDYVYDGTFSGNLIKGDGVTTSILKKMELRFYWKWNRIITQRN